MLLVVLLNSVLDKMEDRILAWRPKESDTRTE